MKDEVRELLGRTVTGAIITQGAARSRPQSCLFLLFSDGHYYEFYCYDGWISTTGGVALGGADRVKAYMRDLHGIVFEAYWEPPQERPVQGVLPLEEQP